MAKSPILPDAVSAVNVARPASSVVALVFVKVATPLDTVALMTQPASRMRFPSASYVSTTGCCVKAFPLAAPLAAVTTRTSAASPELIPKD